MPRARERYRGRALFPCADARRVLAVRPRDVPSAHEHVGSAEVVALLSGERRKIGARKKLVDATRLETSIPLTHQRKFSAEDGVACVPPHDLVRLAPHYKRFAVLGASKTGSDSVCFLLANGVQADPIAISSPR